MTVFNALSIYTTVCLTALAKSSMFIQHNLPEDLTSSTPTHNASGPIMFTNILKIPQINFLLLRLVLLLLFYLFIFIIVFFNSFTHSFIIIVITFIIATICSDMSLLFRCLTWISPCSHVFFILLCFLFLDFN